MGNGQAPPSPKTPSEKFDFENNEFGSYGKNYVDEEDDEKFVNELANDVARDPNLSVIDIKGCLIKEEPDIQSAFDHLLKKPEITWINTVFRFDLIHVLMDYSEDEKDSDDTKINIYDVEYPKVNIIPKQESVSDTISGFLHVDKSSDFWKKALEKYSGRNVGIVFGIGFKYNLYFMNINNQNVFSPFDVRSLVQKRDTPAFIITSIKDNHAIFEILMSHVPIIDDHVYFKYCVGQIALSGITIQGLMYVFGLHLNGELKIQNNITSLSLSAAISSVKGDSLSYSKIMDHFKDKFPKYGQAFDILSKIFSNVQLVNFNCTLGAEFAVANLAVGNLAVGNGEENDDQKNDDQKNGDKKTGDKKTGDKKTGNKKKDNQQNNDDKSTVGTYSIDLSFQPQIDPKGAIGTLLDLLKIDYKSVHDIFPLEFFLKGDNEEGLTIGVGIENRIFINQWLFDEVLYFDSLVWCGSIELPLDASSFQIEASAKLFGKIQIGALGINGLDTVLFSGNLGASVEIVSCKAEIDIGFVVQLPGKGWDPFSIFEIDSDFKIKSFYIGMSVSTMADLYIISAGNFTFIDNDVTLCGKFKIDIKTKTVYPTAIYFEQQGVLKLKDIFDKFDDFTRYNVYRNSFPDNITITNVLCSGSLEGDEEIPYGITFKIFDEKEQKERELEMEDALKKLSLNSEEDDNLPYMDNKTKTIEQGLRLKGSVNICDIVKCDGEIKFTTTSIKLFINVDINGGQMQQIKREMSKKIDETFDEYEKKTNYKSEIESIMKEIKLANGISLDDILSNGVTDEFLAAAIYVDIEMERLIRIKAFELVRKAVQFVLKKIAVYKFLYDLEISTNKEPKFEFQLDMRICDIRIDIDINTDRDFNLESFLRRVVNEQFWKKLTRKINEEAKSYLEEIKPKNILRNAGNDLINDVGDFVESIF